MNTTFWALLRIFEYLLVVILAFGLLKTKKCYVFIGNIIIATFLMLNAINYVLGNPNTESFQITFSLVVGLWAVTHLMQLFKKE